MARANTPLSDLIVDFKRQMKQLARRNGDDFTVVILVDEDGYRVEVTESADGHLFLAGSGATLAECFKDARDRLDSSIEEWGYRQ